LIGDRLRFTTDVFEAFRTIFTSANALKRERSFVNGTNRSAIIVKVGMSRAGITGVEWNTDSFEVKIVAEHFVIIILIKRRITEKSMIGVQKMGVSVEKVREDRF